MNADLEPRLEQRIIDSRTSLEISQEEFESLVHARKTLTDALAFEQRFELLLGNYLDFEVTATRLSLSALAGDDYSTYLPGAAALLEANRLLMNFMTAARAYIDQVKQDFKHLTLNTPFGDQADTLLSAEYDDSLDYRLMEALRNHAQHKGMPAHGYTASDNLHETLSFNCMKEQLANLGGFKASVLKQIPKQVDLRGAARRYVECFSRVHIALRAQVSLFVDKARKAVDDAINRFKSINDGKALGLHAHRVVSGKEEWIGLMVEWDDVRRHLARKNSRELRFSRSKEVRNGTPSVT